MVPGSVRPKLSIDVCDGIDSPPVLRPPGVRSPGVLKWPSAAPPAAGVRSQGGLPAGDRCLDFELRVAAPASGAPRGRYGRTPWSISSVSTEMLLRPMALPGVGRSEPGDPAMDGGGRLANTHKSRRPRQRAPGRHLRLEHVDGAPDGGPPGVRPVGARGLGRGRRWPSCKNESPPASGAAGAGKASQIWAC